MYGLYDRDALAWAEQQADLLRRLAAGERVNGEIDWEHVIDEVHDVGGPNCTPSNASWSGRWSTS